ncbi:MAG: hypothetical protein ACR2QC_04145 [Gammaproteobacteria bacterium]
MEPINKLDALRPKMEAADGWLGWIEKIPFLRFPRTWEIKIIPPFGGAVARFLVRRPGTAGRISVYLDCHERLGCWDGPYWEVYPFQGDVGRCDFDDTKELLRMIKAGFREMS